MKKLISFLLNILFPIRRNFSISAVKSIVVFQFGHIGDIVLSFAFLKALRGVFPQAKISFVCGDWGKEILTDNASADEIIIFNHPMQSRKKDGLISSIVNSFHFISLLRGRKIDLSIDLKGNLNTALINLLSGSRFKAGRDEGGYNFPYSFLTADYNNYEVLNLLALLEKIVDRKIEFDGYGLRTSHETLEKARKKLGANGNNKYIVLHPTTPWKPKDWGKDNYKKLIKDILDAFVVDVVIIGTREEFDANEELTLVDQKSRVKNFSGKLDIMETAAIISKAQLFIGSDSGPMHIAVALGNSVIALMGPGDYPRFAPYNPKGISRVVRHEICKYQKYNDCKQIFGQDKCAMDNNFCMKSITPLEVFAIAEDILEWSKERTCK